MSDFKVLSERDHIRKRPAMYVGAVTPTDMSGIINFEYQTKSVVPALLKIINEVIDNAVDENIRTDGKFADSIAVTMEDEGLNGYKVTVKDNGRGIPVKQYDGVYQAELAWTRARAGSNFDDSGRTTIGMNGVGSFATNCFSTDFVGKSGDGKNTVTVKSKGGCESTVTTVKPAKFRGTTVEFYPDMSLFSVSEISNDHNDIIKDRLTNLAICYPGITFTFNGERIVIRNRKHLAQSFHEDAILFQSTNEKATIVFAPSGDDEEFRHLSYVNGLDIKNGGAHIDYIINNMAAELIPAIKRKWKIDVRPNQIKQHLLLATWVHDFNNPKFDSQSKERLTNTPGEVAGEFTFDFVVMARRIINNESIIGPMVESILHKKELADKRAASAAMKKVQKKRIVSHLEATDKDPRNRVLHITEGQSAIGSLITVRDPKTHGGYPLRGKILNTYGMKDLDILKNKELSELLAVLGLDLSSKSIDGLEYGKIRIMTDVDPDGSAIFCLLLQFFSRWPDLFKKGIITRMMTPLYIARRKAKPTQYFYTQREFDEASENLKGYEVDYIKGLGSLTTPDYKAAIEDPVETAVTIEGVESLAVAFGASAEDRKTWMLE